MNPIKKAVRGFGKWVINKKSKPSRDRVKTYFGDEVEQSIREKELIKKVAGLEGQLSKIQADKRIKKVDDKNLIDELGLINEIKDKSNEIEHKKHDGTFSLGAIAIKLSENKKLKIEIVDKDDSRKFDYFKDFVVMNNGNIGIRGKSGEVWAEGKELSDIIWKPETLKNQFKRKRIQMCYDKDFKFIPDLEKLMMPEIGYDEDSEEFFESERDMRPFKEMLMERTQEINKLTERNAYLDKVTELKNKKIQQIEQSWTILKQRSEIADSETSKAIGSTIDSLKAIGSMARENAVLQDQKLTSDELTEKKDLIINALMDTLEDEEGRTAQQKAKDAWKLMFAFAKKNAPKTIIENNTPTDTVDKVKPGENIGR